MTSLNITTAVALLLGGGFAAAKLGNLLRLPSVTGYICAGFILGPSGFALISTEMVDHQLGHFSQIALMMIAFGIVEHLEIRRLKASLGRIFFIGICETCGAFILVFAGCLAMASFGAVVPTAWSPTHLIILAILLGAVSLATAPASTMHVVREAQARGPLTTTLMAVVAVDNSLAITLFGIIAAVARHLMNVNGGSIFMALSAALLEVAASLALGFLGGIIIDFINNRLRQPGEMLTAGLAILLLTGEIARMLNISALLAGMAAGFTIINREHRDIRLFRALNAFEPPIYVLFFTLAGIHLDIESLGTAGWLGLVYFLCRSLGKVIGASLGAKLTVSPKSVHRFLGLALTPQAGIAIGLIFLINSDQSIKMFAPVIIPVVLAGVFFSELIGPIFVRQAVRLAGEVPAPLPADRHQAESQPDGVTGVPMVPWTWPRLQRPINESGVVLFGANHLATTRALARMAAIFANYYASVPMAVKVHASPPNPVEEQEDEAIMLTAKAEMYTMGCAMEKEFIQTEEQAQGFLEASRRHRVRAIVLGHCQDLTPSAFQKVIGQVVTQAPCPTVVIKFSGVLHTEKILVAVISMRDLHPLRPFIRALDRVGKHKITLMQLLPSYEPEEVRTRATNRLRRWAEQEGLKAVIDCQAKTTDARQKTIITEAANHDLLIMAGPRHPKMHRLLFGSLLHSVAAKCPITMLTVYPAADLGSVD